MRKWFWKNKVYTIPFAIVAIGSIPYIQSVFTGCKVTSVVFIFALLGGGMPDSVGGSYNACSTNLFGLLLGPGELITMMALGKFGESAMARLIWQVISNYLIYQFIALFIKEFHEKHKGKKWFKIEFRE